MRQEAKPIAEKDWQTFGFDRKREIALQKTDKNDVRKVFLTQTGREVPVPWIEDLVQESQRQAWQQDVVELDKYHGGSKNRDRQPFRPV
ncbi:unnamed protein product [Amoebophrya sp. A25]|nr:unnamed protein product [Amoebophrya sp. A25]